MLLSAVSFLVVAQSSSEVPEGLMNNPVFVSPMAQEPLVGQDLLVVEASRSHSDTPHSVGLLCTSDKPVAETTT